MVFPYMKNRIILTDIGLPHVHSLLCLQDDCKFREKLVEELVSIVIPYPNDTVIFNLVRSLIAHCPCSNLKLNSICMVDANTVG